MISEITKYKLIGMFNRFCDEEESALEHRTVEGMMTAFFRWVVEQRYKDSNDERTSDPYDWAPDMGGFVRE
jgi:hypothetical protein